MKRGISECCFRCLRTTVEQVKIVFPGETHAAMDLDATVATVRPASLGTSWRWNGSGRVG